MADLPCISFDLNRFTGPGADDLRDALRKIMAILNVELPTYLDAAFEKTENHPTFTIGGSEHLRGDQIWTRRGELPAPDQPGGIEGNEVLGHINLYAGAGQSIPTHGDCLAPDGAFITDILVDPNKHAIWACRGDPSGYGYSGYSCYSGYSAYSGYSSYSGYSGYSGWSG